MSTQRISFTVRGMFCPRCAGAIERALVQLDGVVAAQVNYATERAQVMYDPTRVTARTMVDALRSTGYDTPVEHVVLNSDDLLYATSGHTLEKVLGKVEGIVGVCADVAGRAIRLDVFPRYSERINAERALGMSGLRTRSRPGVNVGFWFLLRTSVIIAIEVVALWGAGATAGWFLSPGSLHEMLVVIGIALLALCGAGWPFYCAAYNAATSGEVDLGVILALLAWLCALLTLPISALSQSLWIAEIGLLLATTLTASWFGARALHVWALPRIRGARHEVSLAAAQTQLGVISDGPGS